MIDVVVIQRRLTHYRTPLFELLRSSLADSRISLRLVHGQPTPDEIVKKDTGRLLWAEQVKNRYWQVTGKAICWQPLINVLGKADLVVLTQENSLLSNYPLLLKRHLGGPKVAFWGHGANLQSNNPNGIRERFKRWTTNRVDWWFAYTGLSVELIERCGFPRERITNLENAVDTAALRAELASIDPNELAELRQRLGMDGAQVGLYLGSLYAEKRLDIVFETAKKLYAKDPTFRLLIVGDGPMRTEVQRFCMEHSWSVWVGTKTGRDKCFHLSLADVILNPGMVGLGMLDSFIAGVPMVTTDCGLHSPEIAYLRQHYNGVMTENTLDGYVNAVQRILNDEPYRAKLVEGCRNSAQHYTIENMASNFCEGIKKALVS
ncbi:glycosyltransferase family 4 protein [Geobacter sp.]|uniref:glycosyltransferase family 4 protein n=1 Tax=Geobacter sp. TaxID=46610 RepID=UPI002604C672|nr:glycosyltransferase family 4 protein [Geobacter sp.]